MNTLKNIFAFLLGIDRKKFMVLQVGKGWEHASSYSNALKIAESSQKEIVFIYARKSRSADYSILASRTSKGWVL